MKKSKVLNLTVSSLGLGLATWATLSLAAEPSKPSILVNCTVSTRYWGAPEDKRNYPPFTLEEGKSTSLPLPWAQAGLFAIGIHRNDYLIPDSLKPNVRGYNIYIDRIEDTDGRFNTFNNVISGKTQDLQYVLLKDGVWTKEATYENVKKGDHAETLTLALPADLNLNYKLDGTHNDMAIQRMINQGIMRDKQDGKKKGLIRDYDQTTTVTCRLDFQNGSVVDSVVENNQKPSPADSNK